jgi:PAS domain-containing protein
VVDETQRALTPEGPQVRRDSDLFDLLEAAEQVAHIGSWEWLPQADVLRWSDNLYRLFGLEPGEIVASLDHLFQRTHPDDRDRVMR